MKDVYIDFLGYYPNTTFLLMDREENILLGEPNLETIKKRIKEKGYNLICNPRFVGFPKHEEMVREINND
jgi:hypothetical protein